MREGAAFSSFEPHCNASTTGEFAVLQLRERGVAALSEALQISVLLGETHEENIFVLDAAAAELIAAFDADPQASLAYSALANLPANLAAPLFDYLLARSFGEGPRDTRVLNQTGVLSLMGLLSAAGAHEQAAVLLNEARMHLETPAIRHAAWIARCRWAGCAVTPESYWSSEVRGFDTLVEAEAGVEQIPLDIAAHRARARFELSAGRGDKAIEAVATALALPVGDADKMELVEELALLVPFMIVRGELATLDAPRLRWALAAAPGVTEAAAAAIERSALPFLDENEAKSAAAKLRAFIGPAAGCARPPVSPFPSVGGKPRVDTVWLEITNHCNQKCTFCPDMFREDARTWLPLETIKGLIDDLADNVSVGSMQLNAYGEPLLHPNIAEILAYIRERNLPWPTFFTTHGMTLVDKKLKQLSNNYPAGIAISLHNDSEESYRATRSQKIGDYETLVSRVSALLKQMVFERAPSHLRLYQMVANAAIDLRVDEKTRAAFPDTPERMTAHVRKWERIAADIAVAAPPEARAHAHRNDAAYIAQTFTNADQYDREHLPILSWIDVHGVRQEAFMSARPTCTYANLLLEYDPRWSVERKLVNRESCLFTETPSLAIYATGRLGICCLDLNSTATFGSLSDFTGLRDALGSPQALRMFAQLSNGVTTSRGCQICLGGTERLCASKRLDGPKRPAGHFADGV
ncbi:radical SAM protein [Sphingomonas sp. JC676]|uniref:radical SAM/SPASM domain-containing protein n=1 Tax=Sphingomonas sp. JC676 TaxID=2768065 RepID=UPI001657F069|nr:radical SAM protein [Sphingomonas sp. JC676]MBC9034094.1 radical SAM protein [Sphingomonas sp. JC676]